jgi:AraC-like DNA-binding protein
MEAFSLNWYSVPLLFAFVQGWIYALLFWARAWRHGRASDWLFGGLLITFTFEIWEYMLGFAGIEILWREWSFFPRTFSLLLPPLAYFYLKCQFNTSFRPAWRDLWHALPFALYCLYHLLVFAQGPAFVQYWENTVQQPYYLDYIELALRIASQLVYFLAAYQLYRKYRRWAPTQFSETEALSFSWFSRFLWAFLASNVAGWIMTLADYQLNLDFWHDWWDELFNAGLIYYLAITGYAQPQTRKLYFEAPAENTTPKTEKLPESELADWKKRLETLMLNEKPWLEPELSLADLAQRLQTNPSLLSAAVNGAFGKNFNDFVNEYRVEAVKKMLHDPASRHYSLLGIGLECGFNSKSTFNRVFKKMTGIAPGDYAKAAE